jgi:predicted metalloendopeptidase
MFADKYRGVKKNPAEFDWNNVQSAKDKAYLTDAELLSALALTFNKVRGKNPDTSVELTRNGYLKDLAAAMNELAGPDSKSVREGMNVARQRTELLRKIKASTENYERTLPKKKDWLGRSMIGINILNGLKLGILGF